MPRAEVLEYMTGPAFHGWSRQQNIRGSWGGRTSQGWLEAQWGLQRRITNRMVALGMTPILPAFMGSLPARMHAVLGGPPFRNASKWMGFPDQYTGNTALDPTWPTWGVVQSAFLQKQKDLYGGWTSGYYSLDLYTEMKPPSLDAEYLRANSRAVVDSIRAVDPAGVWVINGWLFVNDKKSWTTENIDTWLGGRAPDEVLVLDLASEAMPQWERAGTYGGKPWVWNVLLNYGQNYGLYGALEHYLSELGRARATGGNLVGVGLTPEGINNNEHVFEMVADAAWREIDVAEWTGEWVRRRYALRGPAESPVQEAWRILDNSVYRSNDLSVMCTVRSVFDLVPNADGTVNETGNYLATKMTYAPGDVVRALDLLLSAAEDSPELEAAPAFAYDLVDVARQALMNAGIPWYVEMISQWKAGKTEAVAVLGARIVDLLRDVDAVLATDKNFLLAPWVDDARRWGADAAEADFMETQARNQIVRWGPGNYSPWPLDRYAAKHWHGVVGDVFAVSWELFYKHRECRHSGLTQCSRRRRRSTTTPCGRRSCRRPSGRGRSAGGRAGRRRRARPWRPSRPRARSGPRSCNQVIVYASKSYRTKTTGLHYFFSGTAGTPTTMCPSSALYVGWGAFGATGWRWTVSPFFMRALT
jgi:alpha-N-acetylglucosaminidase